LSHYENYPDVAKRIYRAIGGKKGRLPYWFQFSKNGRKEANNKKKRKYLSPNNSTMNRICAAFKDIGNINLHISDIPPFNWQMFLSEPCNDMNTETCETFCNMDNVNMSNVIESKDYDYVTERESKAGYDLLASMIAEEMTAKYGPLENSYPYIVKYLFAGKSYEKAAHKQMFWRVYGDIALRNLKKNLESYEICPDCRMKYPTWANSHACPKDVKGFFTCVYCNKVYPQMNSRQCRCETCQEMHRKTMEATRKRNKYIQMKEDERKRTGSLESRLKKT